MAMAMAMAMAVAAMKRWVGLLGGNLVSERNRIAGF